MEFNLHLNHDSRLNFLKLECKIKSYGYRK